MKRLLQCIPVALLGLFGFALLTISVHSQSALSIGRGGSLGFVAVQAMCGMPGQPACTCTDDHDVDGQGVEKNDDGTTGSFWIKATKTCGVDDGTTELETETEKADCKVNKLIWIDKDKAEMEDKCTVTEKPSGKSSLAAAKFFVLGNQTVITNNLITASWNTTSGLQRQLSGVVTSGYMYVK